MSKKWYNYFVVTTPRDAPVEGAPDSAPPPARAADLVPGGAEETALPEPPQEIPADFAALYGAAQIPTPAHGYTVLKVADMLRSEHLQSLPADVKQKSILVALEAAGVKIADIVEDAVRRDRALDTYERVLQKNVADLAAQKELENRRLQEEVDKRVAELRAQIAENHAAVQTEQRELDAWRERKRQEEHRIADAVGYFVSQNPITVSTVEERTSNASEPRERSGARGPRE